MYLLISSISSSCYVVLYIYVHFGLYSNNMLLGHRVWEEGSVFYIVQTVLR